MATTTTFSNPSSPFAPALYRNYLTAPVRSSLPLLRPSQPTFNNVSASSAKIHGCDRFAPWHSRRIRCEATEVSVAEESSASGGDGRENWIPVVPLSALPRGERRVILQDGEAILLLWYKDELFAIENRSPAEGAYSEGLLNAKLTQEWYPKNPVLRVLTPALRTLFVFPVKTDEENIYISIKGGIKPEASAEIVFSGKAQPGVTATDVNVEEVRMVVDENLEGFGFTGKNEIINGKAAVIGFLLLLDFELLTGKGLLKGTGFLDFIYSIPNAFK
ncbi:Aromatic-ring-hydroxylating dioxygenase, alpha subunit [Parasponia andersonii]|uniref:Aromatic-ring-hydroxylating dioxygenase, alpha subunit n=1 Tax=Parasponia andersonii TaxID=3476 RepID=A0A2P5DML5_PARAD|nr:Aromatic-ring-hydroxylating dioxygenase, alpha subunit [Parasponia andersonii]